MRKWLRRNWFLTFLGLMALLMAGFAVLYWVAQFRLSDTNTVRAAVVSPTAMPTNVRPPGNPKIFPRVDPDFGWELPANRWKKVEVTPDENHLIRIPASGRAQFFLYYSGGINLVLQLDNGIDFPASIRGMVSEDYLYTYDVRYGHKVLGTMYVYRMGDSIYYNDAFATYEREEIQIPTAPPPYDNQQHS